MFKEINHVIVVEVRENKIKYKIKIDIFKIIKTNYYFKLMETFDISLFNNVPKDKSFNRVDQMKAVQNEGLELFKKKNADYGDAFANYGVVGVLVRMGDKIARLQSISTKCVSLVNTESLRDTLIDLHNYSAMAIMLLDADKDNKDNKYNNHYLNYNSLIPPPPPSPISKK